MGRLGVKIPSHPKIYDKNYIPISFSQILPSNLLLISIERARLVTKILDREPYYTVSGRASRMFENGIDGATHRLVSSPPHPDS
jgi:hypothetical protein